jgi:hypothetical protein
MNKAQENLKQLCGAVLAGNHDEARTLALRFLSPKPKGSSIVRVWFDGACWPNPGGQGGAGALVKRHGQVVLSKAVYLGHGDHLTHEIAEYAGLLIVSVFCWRRVLAGRRSLSSSINHEPHFRGCM